jgi:hypothetical protein
LLIIVFAYERYDFICYTCNLFLIRLVQYRLRFPWFSVPSRPYKADIANRRGRAVLSRSLVRQPCPRRERRSNRKIGAAS